MNTLQRIIVFPVLASILLSACTTGSGTTQEAQSLRSREKKPSVSAGDYQTLVNGNNTFALDLYQTLNTQEGNLFYSPFSISLALAMTYTGARGETETQMANTLHFGSQEQVHPAFNALDLALEKNAIVIDKDQEPMQLDIANSVWAEQTFTFLPDFLDTLAVNYGAGIYLSDFFNNPDPSRQEINSWVSEKTKDKINNLLPEGSVSPDTKMVLVNAIYFKGDWLTPFDPNNTYEGQFNLLDGSTTPASMMADGFFIPFAVGDGYAIAEFPYAGGSAVMDVLLPDEGRFDEIESQLSNEIVQQMLANMSPAEVRVQLPKFTFESQFSLAGTLEQMGMDAAFDASRADFSGMTGKKDLYIGDVIHKAFVAVDEKGTEAAAATAVIMETTAARMVENTFIADRPFIFFIRDMQSGQILFIGRVINPK